MNRKVTSEIAEPPKTILVIKPSSFGDVIHTLPAVALLKRAWPEAQLSWVINPEWVPLIEENPDVQTIIPFPRKQFRGWGGGVGYLRWCQQTLALKPDLTVDFQGLLRSAWMGRASRARVLVGMSDAREGARWFYDRVVAMPAGVVHSVDRYLFTARGALRLFERQDGEDEQDEHTFRLPAGLPIGESESLPDKFLLLHPFARGQGKSLDTEQVVQLGRQLAPHRVVLVGRRMRNFADPLPPNCVDLLDQTTLPQLIWLLRRAAAVLTVDSGPSHLAAALRRPMIAIHTWSDPRRVGPDFSDAVVYKNGKLLTVRELKSQPEAFFQQPPEPLRNEDLAAIAEMATSLSGSSA